MNGWVGLFLFCDVSLAGDLAGHQILGHAALEKVTGQGQGLQTPNLVLLQSLACKAHPVNTHLWTVQSSAGWPARGQRGRLEPHRALDRVQHQMALSSVSFSVSGDTNADFS
jgi:hypothetical protein